MPEQREARILIVDDQRDIARVLKTALELTNHGYFVVHVPSGEEAMLEVQRKEFDILVTEYRLPGMTGPELILKVRKKSHGMKAILISSSPIAEVKRDVREKGIEVLVGIFEKPIDTAKFTAAIDAAVLGERGKKTTAPLVMTEDPLGEIPGFDENTMHNALSALMRDLGCNAVILADRKGKVLLSEGTVDQSLRVSELAVLLAGNFTTTAQIAGYLGDTPTSAVHYYEGEWNDIYAISVGLHFYITVVFPGGSQKQMGPVLRFGKPAVMDMISQIGPLALTTTTAMEAAPVAAGYFDEAAPAEGYAELSDSGEMPVEEAPAPRKKKTANLPPPIEIDIDALDAELAAVGDGAGSDEDFWTKAAEEHEVLADDSISREDAIALGLIPNDEEQG